jgi:PDZ domain-containing protein
MDNIASITVFAMGVSSYVFVDNLILHMYAIFFRLDHDAATMLANCRFKQVNADMGRNGSQWKKMIYSAAGTALFMWLLLYAPTPFVLFQPGIAISVEPMITLEELDENSVPSDNGITENNPHEDKSEGKFLLTAVKLTEPNFWNVAKAAFQRDYDLMRKRDVYGDASRSQYVRQLAVVMQNSQSNAVEAVYRHLSLTYTHRVSAIVITGIVPGEGSQMLEQGDILIGVEGEEPFRDIKDAVSRWQLNRLTNEAWKLVIERGGERIALELEKSAEVAENAVKYSENERLEQFAAWLGVAGFAEKQELVPEKAPHKLTISANNIGGPSAGLVFALQGVDLLTPGDLTGGRQIAATGTISPDGAVGDIGGISQKVVSTSSEGVELFLVPLGNEADARKKAAALHSPMKIAGVRTLQEALDVIEDFIREPA